MSFVNTITLLFNGLTIALALGFLLIVLSQNARKELNQIFAALLFLVTLWNLGSLLTLAFSLVDPYLTFIPLTISIMELGFTGASIAIYSLTTILVGVHSRRFRALTFLSLFIILGYQIFLIAIQAPVPFEAIGGGFFKYRFQPIAAAFYLIFDGTALYLVWRYRRKIQSTSLILGLNLFIVGQSLGFLNPELRIVPLSINLSSIATLIISFAILRQEIIIPLAERITQVEALHKVSLAITSQIGIDTVLDQIAVQAATWLSADGAGIFLNKGEELELVAVHNLPSSYLHARVKLGEGIVGTVGKSHQTIHLENYGHDWEQKIDLPLADETFGSVISIPLIYGGDAIGVLMVIAGRQGRLFQKEDVELLELLGSQAAVAVAHSHLFAEQQDLTRQVETARSELETVLASTENPVVALDQQFRPIFANPAARNLTKTSPNRQHPHTDDLPAHILPPRHHKAIQELDPNHSYTYELEINHKTYLCHITQLSQSSTRGWVAILNDITQLKELDRLKSEMVRMTSHDLKNPLQAAMANLELLSEDLKDNDNEETQKSLTAINKQLQRMNRIISGILDLERVKTGKISITECNTKEIINKVIEDIHELASDQNIALTTEIEHNLPTFWGDAEQIERALINLVENAIKFTPRNGKVAIRATYNSGNISLEVKDTGIGIPSDLQPQVFERFFRGGRRGQKDAEHISGSGLGLSLVKTVIENHHGNVSLTSKVGEGTTFYINLPTRTPDTPEKESTKTKEWKIEPNH